MRQRNIQVLSGFVLKIIALLTMTLDHVGLFLMETSTGWVYQMAYVFRCIGRIAFPLFVLLCAEGVRHTKHPWKYFFRLLIMNVAIKLGMTIYFYGINKNAYPSPYSAHGNAFADLSLIALMLILLKQSGWKKTLAILPFGVLALTYGIQLYEGAQGANVRWFPSYLRADYSLMGALFALGFFYAVPLADRLSKPIREAISISEEAYRDTSAYRSLVNGIGAFVLFAVVLIFWGISYIGFNGSYRPYDTHNMALQSYCLITIPLIYMYSGKRGYDSKPMRWITYLYYPVHMAILLAVFWL